MQYILVINSGSATLKFKVFNSENLKEICFGIVERIGLEKSFIEISNKGIKAKRYDDIKNHNEAIQVVLAELEDILSLKKENKSLEEALVAVGHRVVHGGEEFTEPIIVTPAILKKLEKYNKLAPLHNPANMAGIAAIQNLLPKVKNIAVFDTAFYKTIPDYAYIYALPYELYAKEGIRRYGFHGISHGYVAEETALKLKKSLNKLNLITCHLGSGSSITAIRNGKAIDTSMGFTPLPGLMMSTRCGDIDPSIIFFLMQELNMKPEEVNKMLNSKSGLFGVSGLADMREILQLSGYKVEGFIGGEKASPEKKKLAALALQMFVYSAQKYIGAYLGILGKVDAIVFTGGIGERSSIVRNLIIKGIKAGEKLKVLAILTNEELAIAKEVEKIFNF